MGIGVYFSDEELIANLRQEFDREEQYRIDFRQWLNTARYTNQGIILTVESRKFLNHKQTNHYQSIIVYLMYNNLILLYQNAPIHYLHLQQSTFDYSLHNLLDYSSRILMN